MFSRFRARPGLTHAPGAVRAAAARPAIIIPPVPTPEGRAARAHAKVNLALAVGAPILPGSAGAGYHPIASWMHCVSLADELHARHLGASDASRFSIEWAADAPRKSPIDWPIEGDLTFRAHAALERAAGRRLPVHLTVRKRIPVGGGLGGGSSDAAATLLLLDDMFGLALGNARLSDIGHSLGSDIPFFVDDAARAGPPPPAVVRGLGERIERVAPLGWEVLLLIPPFGCPTRDVYRAFDGNRAGRLTLDGLLPVTPDRRVGLGPDGLFNDLLPAAERVEPRLAELRRRAEALAGTTVRMTGSGSTLYIPSPDPALAPKIERDRPDLVVVRTRLV